MPQIGGLLSPILRSQSASVKRLNAAINKARKSFKPMNLDKVGTRRGEQFHYWSMNEFRKCIVNPLAEHNVTWECDFVSDKDRTYCVAVLSLDEEWKESCLVVRDGYDLMDDRAWKTQAQKELGDAQLQPVVQDDPDSQPEELEDVPAKNKEWDTNFKAAAQKVHLAETMGDTAKILKRVEDHVAAGTMHPDAFKELKAIVERKFTKEE